MMSRVLFLLVAFTLWARAGEPIAFAKLKAGETIQVRYSSNGCFHSLTQEFVFRGGSTVKVTEIQRTWSPEKKAFTEKAVELGTTRLSPKNLSQLDDTLGFYRKPPSGGCTTVDHVELKLQRKDGTVQAESYTDASCSIGRKWSLLTFPDIAKMASKKAP